jgi:hypothetical protein
MEKSAQARLTAGEPLSLQPLPDPLGGVAMLAGQRQILLQNQFDLRQISPELVTPSGSALPVTGRFTVGQDFLQCPQCMPVSRMICRRLTPSTNTRLGLQSGQNQVGVETKPRSFPWPMSLLKTGLQNGLHLAF